MAVRLNKERKSKAKVTKEVAEEIRAMYILGKYTTLEELASRYNVSISWLYNTKRSENWDLLKSEIKEDNVVDVVKAELGQIIGSVEFYDKIMECAHKLLNKSVKGTPRLKFFKGIDVETQAPLEPNELKALVEVYQLAEERKLLLLSVKTRTEGELDEA